MIKDYTETLAFIGVAAIVSAFVVLVINAHIYQYRLKKSMTEEEWKKHREELREETKWM